jgi:hypothetical protein
MIEYRCFYTHLDHIHGVEMIDGANDREAMQKAETLFASKAGKFSGFELWDRGRQVYASSTSNRAQLDERTQNLPEPARQKAAN